MIAMNEIDSMTWACQTKVIGKKLSKSWINKPLADRLKSLCTSLRSGGKHHEQLGKLLKEAQEMCSTRNLVAHGSFVLDARGSCDLNSHSQFLLWSHKADQPASQSEVEQATRRCTELSSEMSECIAVIEMSRIHNG